MTDRSPPTPAAMLIATAIISLVTGYMIGIASSLGFIPIPFQTATAPPGQRTKTSNYKDEEESSEEEVDDSLLDHAPNWANGMAADLRDGLRASEKEKGTVDLTDVAKPAVDNSKEECKLVLVVRTDLGMTKGTWNLSKIDQLLMTVE
jgi:PTH2 family peptidyl-tRNA hydrolase